MWNIGDKIILARKQKNISQKELAEKSKLSQSFISHLEQDKRNPTLDTIYKLANGLDIPIKDFLLYLINELDKIS